jgi:hypothetical protein
MPEILDRLSSGWFVVEFVRKGRDWIALMNDVHPYDLREEGKFSPRYIFVPIPGEHHSADEAGCALGRMICEEHKRLMSLGLSFAEACGINDVPMGYRSRPH